MKYYLDTEFIEYPNTIELISIGIKCENGRTFYAEASDFNINKANNWILKNVIAKLKWYGKEIIPFQSTNNSDFEYTVYGPKSKITEMLLTFIGDDIPEFYGYYADYDWVVFCWLFGAMIDLPKDWPMYCKDLKQMLDELKLESIPQPVNEHNALSDAIWNESLHKYIIGRSNARLPR